MPVSPFRYDPADSLPKDHLRRFLVLGRTILMTFSTFTDLRERLRHYSADSAGSMALICLKLHRSTHAEITQQGFHLVADVSVTNDGKFSGLPARLVDKFIVYSNKPQANRVLYCRAGANYETLLFRLYCFSPASRKRASTEYI